MTMGFALMAAVIAVAVYLVIWGRVSAAARLLAIGLAVIALAVGLFADLYALSRPKPIDLEFFLRAKHAEVVGSRMVEGEGIYLLLLLPSLAEPRYYVMPWDKRTAEQLQKALREAEEARTGVEMRLPFEPSLETRKAPQFYPLPQPALPPKDLTDPPQVYEQEGV